MADDRRLGIDHADDGVVGGGELLERRLDDVAPVDGQADIDAVADVLGGGGQLAGEVGTDPPGGEGPDRRGEDAEDQQGEGGRGAGQPEADRQPGNRGGDREADVAAEAPERGALAGGVGQIAAGLREPGGIEPTPVDAPPVEPARRGSSPLEPTRGGPGPVEPAGRILRRGGRSLPP
ncbi:MAG: hypothetical protein ACR2KV_09530 [Solirubrobacteraceae bacterium]